MGSLDGNQLNKISSSSGIGAKPLFEFKLSLNRRTALLVLGAVFLAGLIQEGMQLFSAVRIVSWNSVFDLGVDLIGPVLALGWFGESEKPPGWENPRRLDLFPMPVFEKSEIFENLGSLI